ncbi:endoribonuclease YbeY, partial [Striga asiatica]
EYALRANRANSGVERSSAANSLPALRPTTTREKQNTRSRLFSDLGMEITSYLESLSRMFLYLWAHDLGPSSVRKRTSQRQEDIGEGVEVVARVAARREDDDRCAHAWRVVAIRHIDRGLVETLLMANLSNFRAYGFSVHSEEEVFLLFIGESYTKMVDERPWNLTSPVISYTSDLELLQLRMLGLIAVRTVLTLVKALSNGNSNGHQLSYTLVVWNKKGLENREKCECNDEATNESSTSKYFLFLEAKTC